MREILDDPELNDDGESLEARFVRCKAKVKAKNPKANEYAVCAHLNPRFSAATRARLRRKMAASRGK